jgi:hypothetical protein
MLVESGSVWDALMLLEDFLKRQAIVQIYTQMIIEHESHIMKHRV